MEASKTLIPVSNWVGLSENEIQEIWLKTKGPVKNVVFNYAHAIESKLKEKNEQALYWVQRT